MADERANPLAETDEGITEQAVADAGATGSGDALPGAEVSVVRDGDAPEEATDPRGIMERIVDAVTQDENEHIDRRSGPSI